MSRPRRKEEEEERQTPEEMVSRGYSWRREGGRDTLWLLISRGRPRLLRCIVKYIRVHRGKGAFSFWKGKYVIFGGRGNFSRQVMSQNYGANLASSAGKGGYQGAGRICEQERGDYPLYIVGGEGGGTGERPPQTDHDDQTKRGSHIPVLFSRFPSLLLQPRKERERDICPTRGREDVYVVCGNNKGRRTSPPVARFGEGGREEGWTKRPVDYAADPATLSVAG